MSQLRNLNKTYLFSNRNDVIIFVTALLRNCNENIIENELPKENMNDVKLVVLDATMLASVESSIFYFIRKKNIPILFLVPSALPQRVKNYIESNYKYIVPFPVHENIFIKKYNEILKNIIHSCNTDICYDKEYFTETLSFSGFFVGESSLIKRVRTKIENVSTDDSSVLLIGETGTGKTTAASIIHGLSRRNKRLLIPLNISTVVDSLASSTFFGTEHGAYTDATTKEGVFKNANKSTLFLDEIGIASSTVQAMLLSVLESGTILKVGSDKYEKVDVRLITATNENLEKLIEEKRFRQDLYYRISDNIINFPPLRKRKEDIPIIVNAFLAEKEKIISEEGMEKLQEYNWPGNIRELHQCLKRVVKNSKNNIISPEEIERSLLNI